MGDGSFLDKKIATELDRLEAVTNIPSLDRTDKALAPGRFDIELKDVSFSYGGGRKVIDHVSLKIPQGTTCAVVGPSGSGKTTLCSLIARFWDVQEGSVCVGGTDVKDCTADSLTAGHFMALTLMKRLQMAGNKPIALIGGGTTMIGDPSGRTDMRKMLTKEDIAHNAACFKKQMEKFIDFSEGKALMLNNADWLLNLNYVELLRDVGACFSVNNMLRAKCYEQRMEKGLSFLEFNYMIMQSYDFYYMFQHYGCNMQFGGDDQWSNMLGGTELIRRKLGKDAYAMTITLLTDSQGKKMGKTAGNAVWLDPNKTSPFEFYQYWRNVGDADVMKCIRMLTFLPLEQINEMSTWKDQRLNEAKEILAYELTSMVHGKEEAEKAQNAARALFSGSAMDTEHMPSTQLTEADLTNGSIGILTLMVKAGLAASNGEARRLVVQGGVLVDGEKVAAPTVGFTSEQLAKGIVIKKGKKIYHKVTL